jgi:hypothetical protein
MSVKDCWPNAPRDRVRSPDSRRALGDVQGVGNRPQAGEVMQADAAHGCRCLEKKEKHEGGEPDEVGKKRINDAPIST